ncbi:MAG: purine-nucleoside phosphorylase [Oscillospiraceae bacterium]|nr:purine-nucleoside phosphorylase [Oscillospiraceae bacterium]
MTADGLERGLREGESFLKARLNGVQPEVALVLGSGLGFLGDLCEDALAIPYADIPGFPLSTAPGHAGRLVFGRLAGKRAAVMQGRFHYYEGYGMDAVVHGIRVLRLLGAGTLLVTNASGGVNADCKPGDIMLITDHIQLFGVSPLRGPNAAFLGGRFPDMTRVYTPALLDAARRAARKTGVELREGVYLMAAGPQYETPAEIRAYRSLGADAVGMSTAPEAVAARHAGMDVLGLSLICNAAAGMTAGHELSEQEVLDTAEAARERFSRLVLACLEEMTIP